MATTTIDAKMLGKMFLAGANALEAKKEWINELNVFPVPDGDTGTNMSLTIMSAAKEVAALPEDATIENISKAISSGSLRGARGNSGVILSQLIRGFTKVIKTESELDVTILTNAIQKAVETAYKAVMQPKEGTILTVAKGASDKAVELVSEIDDVEEFFGKVIEHCEFVLSKTPEMLPVLKEAGVVDSGGQGLVEILKGAYDALLGKEVDYTLLNTEKKEEVKKVPRYTYDTAFTVYIKNVFNAKNEQDLKVYLDSIGDNGSIKADGNKVSVSVLTNDPGLLLQKALAYGVLDDISIKNIKIEDEPVEIIKEEVAPADVSEEIKADDSTTSNVSEEKNEPDTDSNTDSIEISEEKSESTVEVETFENDEYKKPVFTEPPKEIGIISVSIGSGLDEIFKGLGVDYIISGGQTMNPSTDDMLVAIDAVNAKTIFILPNNKNIILAANQAQYLADEKKVIVIPTRTVTQGITALINFMPDNSPEENESVMNEEIKKVKTGQVTYAVRDTVINGMEIKQGNIMGIGDHDILSVGTIVEDTALEMLEKMVDDDSELVSIYYGDEVDEEAAGELVSEIELKYPELDVECHFGGQPIYYYVISVE